MIEPRMPNNEEIRQEEVYSYELLDTPEEKEFDAITKLCAELTNSPISLITLLDQNRNWFKSHFGIPFREDVRKNSFCGHAIHEPKHTTIINNALKDLRFVDNPLVTSKETNVRFYAGTPILSESGLPLGTLCVFDKKAKELDQRQIYQLELLAKQVGILMEHHKKEIELKRLNKLLTNNHKQLLQFTDAATKGELSPLSIIETTVKSLIDTNDNLDKTKQKELFQDILKRTESIRKAFRGSLQSSEENSFLNKPKKLFNLIDVIEDCITLSDPLKSTQFIYKKTPSMILSNKLGIRKVIQNLFSNSITFNQSRTSIIEIVIKRNHTNYHITVNDNGPGIPESDYNLVFNLYKNGNNNQAKGNLGVGLSTSKKIIENLNGKIELSGSHFGGLSVIITLPI